MKENSPCGTQYPGTKLLFSYLLPLHSSQVFSRVVKTPTESSEGSGKHRTAAFLIQVSMVM